MRNRNLMIVAVTMMFCASCKDTSTGDGGLNSPVFNLRITVRNSAGSPVSGLRISVWNLEPWPGLGKVARPARTNKIASSTVIGFDVPRVARVSVTVFDLDETEVSRLIENRLSSAGTYQVIFSLFKQSGTRVYKCRMTARDTATNQPLFADSVYMVLWQPDAAIAVLGITSSAGQVDCPDSLRFPNVLSLPPLVRTDIDPTPLELFAIPDSVIIVASDTVAGISQQFRRTVGRGTNDIQVVWNPPASPGSVRETRSVRSLDSVVVRDSVSVPGAWKLRQNYPNPFN